MKKYLVVFPDVGKDLEKSLPPDVFRSMVSGELVTVPRKYGDTTSEEWRVPMLMAANEIPSYDDVDGRLSRRLAVFEFDMPLRTIDKARRQNPPNGAPSHPVAVRS